MKVSVVIPAYNAERTIAEAVVQSLSQTRGSLQVELIVVDDGSTDDTAAIAEAAGATVIRQQNAGPAVARIVDGRLPLAPSFALLTQTVFQ